MAACASTTSTTYTNMMKRSITFAVDGTEITIYRNQKLINELIASIKKYRRIEIDYENENRKIYCQIRENRDAIEAHEQILAQSMPNDREILHKGIAFFQEKQLFDKQILAKLQQDVKKNVEGVTNTSTCTDANDLKEKMDRTKVLKRYNDRNRSYQKDAYWFRIDQGLPAVFPTDPPETATKNISSQDQDTADLLQHIAIVEERLNMYANVINSKQNQLHTLDTLSDKPKLLNQDNLKADLIARFPKELYPDGKKFSLKEYHQKLANEEMRLDYLQYAISNQLVHPQYIQTIGDDVFAICNAFHQMKCVANHIDHKPSKVCETKCSGWINGNDFCNCNKNETELSLDDNEIDYSNVLQYNISINHIVFAA